MILITGANGLIGSFVARRCLEAGETVRAIRRPDSDLSLLADVQNQIEWVEGDILDVSSLDAALVGVGRVVHAAAIVSFVPRDRARMHKVNIEGTANVVNACLRAGIQKLVYVSSVAALGRPAPRPGTHTEEPVVITENQKWEESPVNSEYARSKYGAELEVWRGVAEGLSAVIVNPSVVLGEGDWHRSSTALFKYVFDEKPFYTAGTLNYVDVLDVAELIFRLLRADFSGERYILNAGRVSYQTFFEKAAAVLGKHPPRYLIHPVLAEVAWRVEAVRSWLTGKSPFVTKETARSAQHHFFYPNTRITEALGYEFNDLDTVLERIGKAFRGRVRGSGKAPEESKAG